MSETNFWPIIGYEKAAWDRNEDDLLYVPKSRRRAIKSTYEAALPLEIAQRNITLPTDLVEQLGDIAADLARFDAKQETRGYELPTLLLRSESAASSQIENLTSSVRNVAAAEITDDAPRNARLIAGNVAAMRTAIALPGRISQEGILAIHKELMRNSDISSPGELRTEQVWIGGTPYSPHGASYVAPIATRVPHYLDDLVSFSRRNDLNAIAQAAIAHAQFETIHPFVDGNGRTGRTLIHKQLADSNAIKHATLPISAGLLHDCAEYINALESYRAGDYETIVRTLASALETALTLGSTAASRIDEVIARWKESTQERKGSAILRLPEVLVSQPVVNAAHLAQVLNLTDRSARNLLDKACEYGILDQTGSEKRGRRYQATELIDILEDAASSISIRRARGMTK